jgi:hypothetical protein
MGSKAANAQLEAVREAYMEWCRYPDQATRVAAGLPRNRVDFAKKWNVNRSTLWRWENDDDFKRETTSVVLGMIRVETLALVLRAVEQKALDGNIPAAKMYFEMAGLTGKMAPGTEAPKEHAGEFDDMTEKQLEEYLASFDDSELEEVV